MTSSKSHHRAHHRLPGDPEPASMTARIVRVDHAGEFGAVRIYEGQLAVLGRSRIGPTIRHMAEQERHHLEVFEKLIRSRRVRPTVLAPLWHAAGFLLGAGTALLGTRAAMACTVAVETAIDQHYREQSELLGPEEAELKSTIDEFRAEEVEHRDIGLAHGAEGAIAYPLLSGAIQAGSKLAIWLSTRL